MTIKTQGGKVITKDGKVSCECCGGCCMYPAQGLGGAQYRESDLPNAVTVDGTSFIRSGTQYGNTANGVILEGNVWAKYQNGTRSERSCLIQGGVVDQFDACYQITFPNNPEVAISLARTGLCRWAYESPCPEGGGAVVFSIEYRNGVFLENPTAPQWLAFFDPTQCEGAIFIDTGWKLSYPPQARPEDPIQFQSSPVGTYYDAGAGFDFILFIITEC